MSTTILFYVSGHGYGHARRTAQVIKALQARRPDVLVHVRSTAAARIFAPLPADRVSPTRIDVGMAERDALTINAPATLLRLEELIDRRDAVVAEELAVVRALQPGLIVADVPFMAGDVAEAAGVPCIAVSNFTWDWICEPLFAADERYAARFAQLLPVMRDGYAKMSGALQLPFGGLCDVLKPVTQAPLVAARSGLDKATILWRAGLDPCESRPRVLIGMRGGLPDSTVVAAALEAEDFLFISPEASVPTGSPSNLRPVPTGSPLDFTDLVSICDVVVSKLGYGTVAECIAGGTRMLWPRRSGFREDEAMVEQVPRYLPALEISLEDFRAGRWGVRLRELVRLSPATQNMRVDGAEFCAEFLDRELSGETENALPAKAGRPAG
jgi:hypothetical protein